MIDYENKTITGDRNKTLKMISDGFDFTDWEIVGVNLSGTQSHTSMQILGDNVQLVRCNAVNLDFVGDIVMDDHTRRTNFHQPPEPEVSEEEIIAKRTAEKLLEIKPDAYANPKAVKEGVFTAFTPEELNGVLGAE